MSDGARRSGECGHHLTGGLQHFWFYTYESPQTKSFVWCLNLAENCLFWSKYVGKIYKNIRILLSIPNFSRSFHGRHGRFSLTLTEMFTVEPSYRLGPGTHAHISPCNHSYRLSHTKSNSSQNALVHWFEALKRNLIIRSWTKDVSKFLPHNSIANAMKILRFKKCIYLLNVHSKYSNWKTHYLPHCFIDHVPTKLSLEKPITFSQS